MFESDPDRRFRLEKEPGEAFVSQELIPGKLILECGARGLFPMNRFAW